MTEPNEPDAITLYMARAAGIFIVAVFIWIGLIMVDAALKAYP